MPVKGRNSLSLKGSKQSFGKRYNKTQKHSAKALLNDGYSVSEVSSITGMSYWTVKRILDNPELKDLNPKAVQVFKKGISHLAYKRSVESLLAITPQKLEKSSAVQNMVISKIGVETARLMEGLSTSNVAMANVNEAILSSFNNINGSSSKT